MAASSRLTQLPLELIRELVLHLPREDQRACLSTSRRLYTVALPVLFGTVKVYFGDWDALGLVNVKVEGMPYALFAGAVNTKTRTRDMLNHISATPAFAAACRRLIVYAYAQVEEDSLERSTLLGAISSLPHLSDFLWFGFRPTLGVEILKTLTEHCADNLRVVRLPNHSWEADHLDCLHRLTSFTTENQMNIDYFPQHNIKIPGTVANLQRVIDGNAATLRTLTIPYSALNQWNLPQELFRHLDALSIYDASSMSVLDPVFEHATNLVSLSLVQLEGFSVFDSFAAYPDAFPRLRHFKLMLLDQMGLHDARYAALCAFLDGRAGLERVDVDTPGADPQPLLTVLERAPRLRVLGVDLRTVTSEEHLETLANMLPETLTALHTQHAWEGLSLDALEMQPILEIVMGLPDLRFLHLNRPLAEDLVVAAEIAKECEGPLEMIGLGETFYSIDRTLHAVNSRLDQHCLLLQLTSENTR